MTGISVILPVYNADPKQLSDAVISVLDQTYQDFELLVLDDGSKIPVCETLGHIKDQRLKLFTRENKGLSASLNELIQLSSFEIVARMDSDDVCLPRRLELQMEFLRRHPDVVMVGTQVVFISGAQLISTRRFPVCGSEIRKQLLRGRFPLCHPAVMFRKKVALSAGCYRIDGPGEDLDFFLRISEIGDVANVDEILLQYRIQGNSLSTTKLKDVYENYRFALLNARRRAAGEIELDKGTFVDFERRHAWSFLNQLKFRTNVFAELCFRRALIMRAEGFGLSVLALYFVAAAMRPVGAINRMWTRIAPKAARN
mgnify:CR=1 FL=1